MNNELFKLDWGKLVQWLTPVQLRKPRMLAWQRVLIWPLIALHQDLCRYRKAKLYEMGITPQVCRLQALLNDRFDYMQRRIRIVDSMDKPPLWLATEAENKPLWLATTVESKPQWIPTDSEAGLIKDDFVVLIPGSLPAIELELMALLKSFKLAGTRPKVQRV